MIKLEKHADEVKNSDVSYDPHSTFIEKKKPAPIPIKKRLPSLKWLEELADFLIDIFT